MNLSDPSIRRPVSTVLVFRSAVLFGIYAYFSLPVSDMPDVDYPVFVVNAQFPGAEPSVMANNVATPLERQMMEIQGLAQLISNNTFGNTQIVLLLALRRLRQFRQPVARSERMQASTKGRPVSPLDHACSFSASGMVGRTLS